MSFYNDLSPEEEYIILRKGTEAPGTGRFLHHKEGGTYVCRRCNAPLYRSRDKFESGCGWPAFDDEVEGAVRRVPDPDGRRTEITCANCGGHLGHVFDGERLTPKNVRHCVNSVSLDFRPDAAEALEEHPRDEIAYFAAGCFWGVEHFFKQQPGVVSTTVGYMGGKVDYPRYREVCEGDTGHAEVLRVAFDPAQVSYERLCRLFFEIHDFTQEGGQGPDIGDQYRSEIFVGSLEQERIAKQLLDELKAKGYHPVTKVTGTRGAPFWRAEDYHQDYYRKTGKAPYCHRRRKVF